MLRSTLDVELKFDAHQKENPLNLIRNSLFGALERSGPFSSRSKNPQPTLYPLH